MKGGSRGTPLGVNQFNSKGQKIDDNLSTCERKKLYATKELAHAAKLALPAGAQENLRPYRCPDCRQWHLGHPHK